jgi:hypothetical protein
MVQKKRKAPIKEERLYFFLVTARGIYKSGENTKERTVNIIMQLPSINVTQSDLFDAQRAVQDRLNQENNVAPEDFKDIVFLSFSILGFMTEKEFHNVQNNKPI